MKKPKQPKESEELHYWGDERIWKRSILGLKCDPDHENLPKFSVFSLQSATR